MKSEKFSKEDKMSTYRTKVYKIFMRNGAEYTYKSRLTGAKVKALFSDERFVLVDSGNYINTSNIIAFREV